MLDAIGVGSLEDLFDEIPAGVRLQRPLDLPDGMSEGEVFDHLSALAARNRHADAEVTFLGAGMYDHYVPSLIDSILARSEFLTPYTPVPAGDLAGRAAGHVRVPDGHLRAHRAAGVQRLGLRGPVGGGGRGLPGQAGDQAERSSWSRAACIRTRARRCATHAAGYRMSVEEAGLNGEGATDVDALAAAGGRRHRRGVRAAAQLPRHGRGARRPRRGRQAHGRPLRGGGRPAAAGHPRAAGRARAPTCAWARARRWATGWTSAAPRSGSSPPTSASSARCPAGSPARRATWTASAASCSPCRRASSTSAARRPRTTSAPRRRSTRWPAWCTCPGSASAGSWRSAS